MTLELTVTAREGTPGPLLGAWAADHRRGNSGATSAGVGRRPRIGGPARAAVGFVPATGGKNVERVS